ncbi:DNA cytosine methyltransferase [Actinomadura formosensis]|uniref:DNA cytosine methyltransferase n=1 Tax=Actinomadura formosensis TaxID=60706 RepID=UPI003D8D375D
MSILTPPDLDGWTARPSGLLVRDEAAPHPQPKPVAIDCFAGAGGFSLGFKQAGWHVAAAVEWDLTAAATYLCNLGGPDTIVHVNEPDRIKNWDALQGDDQRRWVRAGASAGFGRAGSGWIATSDHRKCRALDTHADLTTGYCVSCHWTPDRCGCAVCVDAEPCEHFWVADVQCLTGGEILDALDMRPGEVGAVIGGPPCQGFSMAGRRDVMDPRNSLVFDFARLILEIRPQTMVMENVVGIQNMVTPEGVPVVDMFCRILADGDYAPYEALKRSMEGMPGARAAVRAPATKAKPAAREDPDERQLGFDFEVTP